MSPPKLKLRHRDEWVVDVEYSLDVGNTKEAAWVFPTKELAEAKIKRLVDIKIGTYDEPETTA